ncbi:phage major capsid protein, partial [Bacillus sp. S34]|nr:phage major capsid protein [Bacillus sp. S34]
LYGDVKAVKMSRKPRAQIVAEGAQKSSDTASWDNVIASPIKFQTTVRMTDEVKWVDEDHRLEIVQDLTDAVAES